MGLNCSEFDLRGCAISYAWPWPGIDESYPGHLRKPQNILHGEDQRALDQAVDHQPVLLRVDIGPSRVMALEKQPVGRDDAPCRSLQR